MSVVIRKVLRRSSELQASPKIPLETFAHDNTEAQLQGY